MKYLLLFFILPLILSVSINFAINDDVTSLSSSEVESLLEVTYEEQSFLEQFLTSSSSFLSENSNHCANRENFTGPDFFMFVPDFKGKVKRMNDSITFSNTCFKKNTLTFISETDKEIILYLEASDSSSLTCFDTYVFQTSTILHISTVFFSGKNTIHIKKLDKDKLNNIHVGGLRVFSICDSIANTAISAYRTIKFLLSDYPKNQNFISLVDTASNQFTKKTAEEQEKEHIEFLDKYAHIKIEQRTGYEKTVLDLEDKIESGDFLGLSQVINGESCLIQYITGGRISHSAMAIRVNGSLYVTEAEESGIILRPYKDFIEAQVNTYHSVAWFPLSKEARAKFDVDKAIDFISKRVGLAYGMKNFVSAEFDTLNSSLPSYMSSEHLLLAITIIEKLKPELAMTFLGHSINMRLGTSNLTTSQVVDELSRRNMTYEEALIIPEKDDWLYYDGENWVCSSFIAGIYKASGLFGNLDIEAHEFVPKDIYQLKIYDNGENRPQECKEADPNINYCMILGKFRIKAEGYNTIEVYEHMNEKCPSVPPFYVRTKGC